MNKIGLITTQNVNNYGAALQCYALYYRLQKYGKVNVINYDNQFIGKSMELLRFSFNTRGFLSCLKDLLRIRSRKRAIDNFKIFQKDNFQITEPMKKEDLISLSESYDYFIAGSDQIWNPNCISSDSKIDPTYFLNFGTKKTIMSSYASSIGDYKFNEEEKDEIKKYLLNFKRISVREADSQNYLGKLLGLDVEHVCDPTLLLNKNEYIKLLKGKNIKKIYDKYILVYSVCRTPSIKSFATQKAKELGLPIIYVDQDPFFNIKAAYKIKDAGPYEFIYYIMNSSYVITDSFHGTCFSLIFEKNFNSLTDNPNISNNRIFSLLDGLDLSNRIVNMLSENQSKINLNYSIIKPKFQKIRRMGLNYLESIFN